MTCRDDVLDAVNKITKGKKTNEFRPEDVVAYLIKQKTKYNIFSIRDAIQTCCSNCPKNKAKKDNYYLRIEKGRYRLLDKTH